MAYDSSSSRVYYYNSSDDGTFYSMKLDGSDVRAVIKTEKLVRFTFDSKQKFIYYIHELTDQIHSVNITSMQDNAVAQLLSATDAKDLDMDSSGWVLIGKVKMCRSLSKISDNFFFVKNCISWATGRFLCFGRPITSEISY